MVETAGSVVSCPLVANVVMAERREKVLTCGESY